MNETSLLTFCSPLACPEARRVGEELHSEINFIDKFEILY